MVDLCATLLQEVQVARYLFLPVLLIMAAFLPAQDRGTITGVITDSTGQVVPNTRIVATNEATGIRTTTVSSESGDYTISLLTIGNYKVEAQAAGFKTSDLTGVPVQV